MATHYSKKNSTNGASLRVSWGNRDVEVVDVSLRLSVDQWRRVQAGEPITVTGNGYVYDGEKFQDTWYFNHNGPRNLTVSYASGEPFWEGDGFIGSVDDALTK